MSPSTTPPDDDRPPAADRRLRRPGGAARGGAGGDAGGAADPRAGDGLGERPRGRGRGDRDAARGPRGGAAGRASRDGGRRPRRASAQGIAIGSGVARELGVGVGDVVTLVSPEGMDTPFGTQPRISDYEVGLRLRGRALRHRPDAGLHAVRRGADLLQPRGRGRRDRGDGRRPGRASSGCAPAIAEAAGPRALLWTWRDASGAFLSALDVERRVMFIILSLVVLIAGAQHHLRPRHAGEEQGARHRHPADHGADRKARSCGSSSSAAR